VCDGTEKEREHEVVLRGALSSVFWYQTDPKCVTEYARVRGGEEGRVQIYNFRVTYF